MIMVRIDRNYGKDSRVKGESVCEKRVSKALLNLAKILTIIVETQT